MSSTLLQNICKFPTLTNLKANAAVGIGSLLITSGVGILWKQYFRYKNEALLKTQRPSRLIVITGCDSGLGFCMAYWAGKLGYKVVAGCLNYESGGGQMLRKEFGLDNVFVVQMDVTDLESIKNFQFETQKFLERHAESNLRLWAVIPNAAVGIFGESFWLTQEQQHNVMDVNFWGSVNLTKAFEPLLLTYKCRLIVVTSDCSEFSLPSLSIYSATKAALHSWALGLRQEVAKYGVSVVTFQPGSFPFKSNLFCGQQRHYQEMKESMSETQLEYYGDYFHNLNQFIIKVFCDKSTSPHVELLNDSLLYSSFQYLIESNVKYIPIFKAETLSIRIFHSLLRNLPIPYSDALVVKLMKHPVWKSCKE